MSTLSSIPGRVAILLATFNGQRFLEQQLDSIEQQIYANWQVYATDDGSNDNTLSILQQYQQRWGRDRLAISRGPQRGFAANFLSLVYQLTVTAEFYAYADQDDVWFSDKFSRAVQWLQTIPSHQPALYCSRTCLIDEHGRSIGLSPLFCRPPHFANALVQSIAGGNTMVFNQAARRLLGKVEPSMRILSHDWLTYLIVSGCGGIVFYDEQPSLGYRQHGNNAVGSNCGWLAKLNRVKAMLQGRFKQFNDCNIQVLKSVQADLSLENRERFEQFCAARQQGWLSRLLGMKRCQIYRQTSLGNLGLLTAILLNKI